MSCARWNPVRRVVFMLVAGSLYGCTFYPFGQPDEQASAPKVPPHRTVAHLERAPAPMPSPKPQVLAALPDSAIGRVIGLDERQVQTKLGQPAAREERHPGTAWIYRDADCRLEISFYPDVQTHAYKALGYEVTSNVRTSDGKHRCASRFAGRIAAAS